MATNEVSLKQIGFILGFGALGGLLSIVYAATLGQPLPSSAWWTFPASAMLGMFAGFIGVFVIANTDTRDFLRCLGFALLCGFSWKPMYDAGSALVSQQTKVQAKIDAKEYTQKTAQAANELATAHEPPPPQTIRQYTSNAFAAIQAAKTADDPTLRSEAITKSLRLEKQLERLKDDGKLSKELEAEYSRFRDNVNFEKNAFSASFRNPISQ